MIKNSLSQSAKIEYVDDFYVVHVFLHTTIKTHFVLDGIRSHLTQRWRSSVLGRSPFLQIAFRSNARKDFRMFRCYKSERYT